MLKIISDNKETLRLVKTLIESERSKTLMQAETSRREGYNFVAECLELQAGSLKGAKYELLELD